MIKDLTEAKAFARQLKEHHQALIAGIEPTLKDYQQLRGSARTKMVESQIIYWKNAIAALKWSTKIAMAKAKIDE